MALDSLAPEATCARARTSQPRGEQVTQAAGSIETRRWSGDTERDGERARAREREREREEEEVLSVGGK